MASYNVQMNMLNESGGYDIIWPEMNCKNKSGKDYYPTTIEIAQFGEGTKSLQVEIGNNTYIRLLEFNNGIYLLSFRFKLVDSSKVDTTIVYYIGVNGIKNFIGTDKEGIFGYQGNLVHNYIQVLGCYYTRALGLNGYIKFLYANENVYGLNMFLLKTE